jgi:hypothetical protein
MLLPVVGVDVSMLVAGTHAKSATGSAPNGSKLDTKVESAALEEALPDPVASVPDQRWHKRKLAAAAALLLAVLPSAVRVTAPLSVNTSCSITSTSTGVPVSRTITDSECTV